MQDRFLTARRHRTLHSQRCCAIAPRSRALSVFSLADEPEEDEPARLRAIIRIFPYGVSRSKIERAVANLRVPALIARKWDDADVVLTLKALERRDNGKLREIAAQNIPIYALKTNTTAQIQTCLKDLYDLPTVDDEDLAIREAEEAVYQVMLHHKSIELSPQSSYPSAACSMVQMENVSSPIAVDRDRAESPRPRLQRGRAIASGLFVTFEGVEGAGKSTQVRLLHEYLSGTTIPFIFTREPGGTPLGEKLRQLLIDPLGQMAPRSQRR